MLLSQLKRDREDHCSGRRCIAVGGVDIGQRRIERAVPEMLAIQKSIRAGPDHEHCGRVFQHVGMLQGYREARGASDRPEQLEDRKAIQARAFLRVENEVIRIGLPDVPPRLESDRLIEQPVALHNEQVSRRIERAFPSGQCGPARF
jgi:hypothetical protein